MKKSLPREVLEHLLTCGSRMMLSSLFVPYRQGLSRTVGKIDELFKRCPHDFSRHSQRTISATLSRMKKQKLISVAGPNKKAIWRITQKGRDHFKITDNGMKLPPEDGKMRIIMFDIPEDRRDERNWLRKELLGCAYTPLQKSVFMGTRPLPKKLLEELAERKLMPHVHVVGLENV